MKKMGYLGPNGSNSHKAYGEYSNSKNDFSGVEYKSIEAIVEAVELGNCEIAIVPIENSIEGSVNVTLDMISESKNIKIIGEEVLKIDHSLMIKENSKVENIKYIISHPQAIAQCREYIYKKYPNVEIIHSNSTSEAAKKVSLSNGEYAAIATDLAASIFGLKIIDKKIQDIRNNHTRFVIISKEEYNVGNKTTIMFNLDNKVGKLFDVLNVFKEGQINLSKIESRPSKRALGEYVFFIDIDVNINKQINLPVLNKLKEITNEYKILGIYKENLSYDVDC